MRHFLYLTVLVISIVNYSPSQAYPPTTYLFTAHLTTHHYHFSLRLTATSRSIPHPSPPSPPPSTTTFTFIHTLMPGTYWFAIEPQSHKPLTFAHFLLPTALNFSRLTKHPQFIAQPTVSLAPDNAPPTFISSSVYPFLLLKLIFLGSKFHWQIFRNIDCTTLKNSAN